MSRTGITWKTLRDVRVTAVAIGGTCCGMALFAILIYPEYAASFGDVDLPDFYDSFTGGLDITSPEGFLNAEFYSWIPLLLIVQAIIGGTGALAGEEGAGTMDQLLAQPIRRRDLVVKKAAGVAIGIVLSTLATLPGVWIASAIVDFDVSQVKLVFATLNMVPLALFYLGISLWAGAALPTRGAAVVVAVGAVVVPFLVYTVLGAAGFAEGVQKLTPFYWGEATEILKGNARWQPAAVFLGLFAGFVALAVVAFERRDIAVGGWSPMATVRRTLARTGVDESEGAAQATPRQQVKGS
jgi:ABC-2 type transport system permease protein